MSEIRICIMIGLSMADAAMTTMALGTGCAEEANPFMRLAILYLGVVAAMLLKVAMQASGAYLLETVGTRLAITMNYVTMAIMSYVCINGIAVLSQAREAGCF